MSAQRHTALSGWAMILVAALCAGAAGADDVFLANGNSFVGVIVVSETQESVKIRLAYGDLSLPRSWIERIELATSPLEEYVERRARLRAGDPAGAASWLELARWARSRELGHGYKEALLEAALLEPRHPGLPPHMRAIDYVFEADSGLWVSAAERRRAADAALAAERSAATRERERVERHREADRGSATEGTLSRAVEALALAELERETRRSRTREESGFARGHAFYPIQTAGRYGAVYPVAFFPGTISVPQQGDGASTGPVKDPYESLRRRQPGSLLVTRPGGGRVSSLSRVRRQPGSLSLGNP